MPTIVVTTVFEASQEHCFDLARDVELHCKTAAFSGEKIVGGRDYGLVELGDTVTFEGRHFGVRQRLTAKIVEFDRPNMFVDEMISGAFKSLVHVHEFEQLEAKTIMRDTITWISPLGILGRFADLLIAPYLRSFVIRRNHELKKIAETRPSS